MLDKCFVVLAICAGRPGVVSGTHVQPSLSQEKALVDAVQQYLISHPELLPESVFETGSLQSEHPVSIDSSVFVSRLMESLDNGLSPIQNCGNRFWGVIDWISSDGPVIGGVQSYTKACAVLAETKGWTVKWN